MARKLRKLVDIDVDEVSIVDAAANRRRFYFVKREDKMDELKTLLKEIGVADGDAERIAKQDIPADALSALKGALKTLSKYKEDFPDDVAKAIGTLASAAGSGYPEVEEEEKKKADKKADKKCDEDYDEEKKPKKKSELAEIAEKVDALAKAVADLKAPVQKAEDKPPTLDELAAKEGKVVMTPDELQKEVTEAVTAALETK